MQLSILNKYKENARIEAKKAAGGLPHSIWETYSAFANTSGGVILLGVAENKKDKTLYPVDLPDPGRLVAQFWELVNDKRVVSANLLKKTDVTVENVEGKDIVVICVRKAKRCERPVYIGNNPKTGAYYRDGEADLRFTEEQVARLIEEAKLPKGVPSKKIK
ncbi:MAG: ATP-binding protein [Clostridia bacterium]|nr:ATP-binding protein [Clostridia bacterium]